MRREGTGRRTYLYRKDRDAKTLENFGRQEMIGQRV